MKREQPHIHVACAIIEGQGKVLAAQRNKDMSLPLKWEFPGGKIKQGESPKDCLQRELKEELGVTVDGIKSLPQSTHHYATFSITLYPLICTLEPGEITLHEHAAIAWVSPEEMYQLDWAEADLPVIEAYLQKKGIGE